MSYSSSYTGSQTGAFTIADAKELASNIKVGLTYLRVFCGQLTDEYVQKLTLEAAILLKAQLLEKVVYGYKKDDDTVVYALIFTVNNLGQVELNSDSPSPIDAPPYLDGAKWFSYLYRRHNPNLNQADRDAIEKLLPIHRTSGEEPSLLNGTRSTDDTYYRNGYQMTRSVYRGY